MDEIITERSASVLGIKLNRPAKKNAMTSSMYVTLADVFNDAARDEQTRVVLWHGAGDLFCAGNDLEDFLKNPPGPGDSPQARLMNALVDFDKPIVAAVQGAAIGGNDHADALRLRLRRRERKVPNALYRSCCASGIWIELLCSGNDRTHSGSGTNLVGLAL